MRMIAFAIRHFIPIGLIAALGAVIFSAVSPAESARVDGFGIEMSALPAATMESADALMTAVASSGAKYVVQEINWSQIETSPDVYNWSAAAPLDLLVTAANSRGIEVVAVLTGGPVYLAASGQPVDREAFGGRWEKFVQAAAGHFGASVNIWQIGSGINSYHGMSPFLFPLSPQDAYAPDTEFYAALLRSASKVIKGIDPNDQVWMGSLAGFATGDCAMNPLTFMLEMNASRAWKSADALLYQPHQGAAVPEAPAAGMISSACSSTLMSTPTSITAEVQAVQELARQLGGKPVIISGLKWNDSELAALAGGRTISADQLETDLLVRASVSLMSRNSISTILWNSDVVNNQSSRFSLSNLQNTLTDAKPLGQLQGASGAVSEYRFRKGGKIISIAWRSVDGDTPYPVSLDASDISSFIAYAADAAAITNETGTLIPVNSSGQAVVMLNERPVIFMGKSGDIAGNIKQGLTDQAELLQIEIQSALAHWLNDQKAAALNLLDQWFEQAKESAVEWGENKIQELLP